MKTNPHNLQVKVYSEKDLQQLKKCYNCGSDHLNFYLDHDEFQAVECIVCGNGFFIDKWIDNFPLGLNGLTTDGSFDSKKFLGNCIYCSAYGQLRKKQTRINGWDACCEDCYNFFGNPTFRVYLESPNIASSDMIHFFVTGKKYGFKDCCIQYFITHTQANGIEDKIPEYFWKDAHSSGQLKCPDCMIEQLGGLQN